MVVQDGSARGERRVVSLQAFKTTRGGVGGVWVCVCVWCVGGGVISIDSQVLAQACLGKLGGLMQYQRHRTVGPLRSTCDLGTASGPSASSRASTFAAPASVCVQGQNSVGPSSVPDHRHFVSQ
eukprot:COSAG06_NODE_1550_length_9129_cov_4.644408_9_plen_124_part_00